MSRFFLIIFFLFLFVSSCKRGGCRDVEALNYNSKAEVSDYTCIFESKGVIYWNQSSQDYMLSLGATHLTVVFNHDTLFNQKEIVSFGPFNSIDCNNVDWILFDEHTYDDDYEIGILILDQNLDTLYGDKVTMLPGCNTYELTMN